MDEQRKLLLSLLERKQRNETRRDIAIIGLSGRYPMSDDLDALWGHLRRGESCISKVPEDRWVWEEYVSSDPGIGESYTPWGGFIRDVDKFDPLFFNISPVEAEMMDPQERLFLEVAFATLEDAGYSPKELIRDDTRVGVFAGAMNADYEWLGGRIYTQGFATDARAPYWSIANRVSYYLNLQGPSFTVDSACSGSLTAVHLACESIRRGDCRVALAGGVSLVLHPMHYARLAGAHMISRGEKCRSFGIDADGFVVGEGVGAVLLKPLSRAEVDGDHIYGIIKGSAINAGGKTSGFTVPNPNAQADLVADTLKSARIDPRSISYIEAHGTGTALGDPIEITGLNKAFRLHTRDTQYCAIGSIKSNVGHLESAAGIAGLTKVLLQMKHKQLVPSLHSETLNPKIDIAGSPFYVQHDLQEWKKPIIEAEGERRAVARRAGIGSFGGGGANAHLIVEEYDHADTRAGEPMPARKRDPVLVVLSARNDDRLRVLMERFFRYLDAPNRNGKDPDRATLRDLAFTLQVGREAMEKRWAAVVTGIDELKESMRQYLAGMDAGGRFFVGTIALDHGKGGMFMDGLEGKAFIDSVMEQGKLSRLAQVWVSGVDLDWSLLYVDETPKRIALPTYPFLRKRYWIPDTFSAPRDQSKASRSDGHLAYDSFFYTPVWVAVPMEIDAAATATRSGKKAVCVVYAGDVLHLHERLAEAHAEGDVVFIRLGTETKQEAADRWAVRIGDGSAFEESVNALKKLGKTNANTPSTCRVYFLGGLREQGPDVDDADDFDRTQEQGVLSLLRLIQSLDRHGFAARGLELRVVTNDVYPVVAEEHLKPFSAGLFGLTMAVAKDYPVWNAACLDIALEEMKHDTSALTALLAWMVGGSWKNDGNVTVIRERQRYIRKLQVTRIPPVSGTLFRENGAYLIVGGGGGIGRALSLYLAKTVRAKLIWIGRGELGAEQQETVEQIKRAGGDVVYCQGDIADGERMRRAVEEGRTRFGPIRGVFHSAMALHDEDIGTIEEKAFRGVLDPKVWGSFILQQVVRDDPLDFMVFFSSAGAFAANERMCGYAAASTFEDAFALYLNRTQPYPVTVINWGYWGKVGSGAKPGLYEIFEALGTEPLTLEDGMEAVRRILAYPIEQCMPIRADRSFLEKIGLDPLHEIAIKRETAPALLHEVKADVESFTVPSAPLEATWNAFKTQERISERLLLLVFQRMGVFSRSGESYDQDALKDRLKIIPVYTRLYVALLRILKKAGFIEWEGARIVTLPGIELIQRDTEMPRLEKSRDEVIASVPDVEPSFNLMWAFFENYPQILQGDMPATDVMFPDSSIEFVAGLYKGNAITDYFNDGVAQGVERFIEAGMKDRLVHIIEIGAGTGATSERVLKALTRYAGQCRYTYTDISSGFTRYAREKFGNVYPFMDFSTLNLEKTLEEQEYTSGQYDIVIATNVLHATRNLRNTLRTVKELLKPNGWLALNELTEVRSDITFAGGVIEGWWLFDEEVERLPDSPLLSVSQWRKVLWEEGFGPLAVVGENTTDGGGWGQHLLIAESKGWVRRALHEPDTERSGVDAKASEQRSDNAVGSGRTDVPFEEDVQRRVTQIILETMKLEDEPDVDRSLADYGFDSLTGVRVVNGLKAYYDKEISIKAMLEHATIRALSTYLIEEGIAVPTPQEDAPRDAFPTDPAMAPDSIPAPEPVNVHTYPLSAGQRALWIIYQSAPESYAYNLPLAFTINPDTDVALLRKCLQEISDAHDTLRVRICIGDAGPVQSVLSRQEICFRREDLSEKNAAGAFAVIQDETRKPFRLEEDRLMRVTWFDMPDRSAVLLIVFHHIIFDGVSIQLFIDELCDRYRAEMAGVAYRRKEPAATFKDFVEWQQKMLHGNKGARLQSYWLKQIPGDVEPLELPTDKPRSRHTAYRGATWAVKIDPVLSNAMRALAVSEKTTTYHLLLSIFKLLLFRYSGRTTIPVGTPLAGRPDRTFDEVIGYFVNMAIVRSDLSGDPAFRILLGQVRERVLDVLDHGLYPFMTFAEEWERRYKKSSAELIRTTFYFQNWIEDGGAEDPLGLETFPGIHQEGEFDLTLEVIEGESCQLHFKYNSGLFLPNTIERLAGHYIQLVKEVIAHPDKKLSEYALITSDERDLLLRAWNDTAMDYPRGRCVHELFERQAHATPGAIAVMFENEVLTYAELNKKSTILAKYLQLQGVTPDHFVALFVDRSLDMIVGLLGILKAGGAYIPLDTGYPPERLTYMLDDSRALMILTTSVLAEKIAKLMQGITPADHEQKARVIALDGEWDTMEQEAAKQKRLQRKVKPNHLAYVIYTSGSTGKPKGVMIPHQALTNFLISMGRQPGLRADDKLFAVTTYCFDIAGLELYLPLIKGAECWICHADTAADAEKLKEAIERLKPTIMQATPSTWTMLFHAGWKNETNMKILCGGEPLPESLKQQFTDSNSKVWNLYGPTETTIWSTVQQITKDRPISIGKPIANTGIYIVDDYDQLTPVGISGELCIDGDGLARGYLNRPELTAEKFVDHPFRPGEKLYRTRDLARWVPDGTIEHLGRMDLQVKIRGFRIEIGEIETQLNRHPSIKESVVVANEQAGSNRLIAYYVQEDQKDGEEALTAEALIAYLKTNLPDYMIPAHLISLENIPLTPNGKTDRKALMRRELTVNRTDEITLPQSEIEERLLAIWKEVLQLDEISTTDGFFEVGGNSILTAVLTERIRKTLDGTFTATHLFAYPTIQTMSAFISAAQGTASISTEETAFRPDQVHAREGASPQNKGAAYPEYYQDSLAIIGISCRVPGANNHHEFWDNLRAGKGSSRFLSREELRQAHLPEALIEDPDYVPLQLTIEGKDLFDPEFFNISAQNAEFMDPQFRLVLLHAWQAIEDAGYRPLDIPETAVFMSTGAHFYQAPICRPEHVLEDSDAYLAFLLAQAGTVSTMISYQLGLKGPSFSVHSNCSSSLVGIHSAYQSLRLNEAKCALIGAASIFPSSKPGYVYQTGMNFSSDGYCRTFDASADGMVAGEGVAVIVVKKALDAIKDGDHIYALLRGIAINNDGSDKAGFYAPSVKGQSEVIRKVLDATKVDPGSIGYVEAHGTATKMGDPIEVAALSEVYRTYTRKKQFCGIGSVKSNIGHLDTVAGLAGCIKVALSLDKGEIPPSINYNEPNPAIAFTSSPFYVVDHLKKWEKNSVPRRAALSSFGIGGTNAHAILEEYVGNDTCGMQNDEQGKGRYVIVLSAKNGDRLKEIAQNLQTFIIQHPLLNISSLAYTLQVGREAMEERLALIVESVQVLAEKLQEFVDGREDVRNLYRGRAKGDQEAWTVLRDDEDADMMTEAWIRKGKYGKLLALWVKGSTFDWNKMYDGSKPQRISLPTYPFARERYWLENQESAVHHPESAEKDNGRPLLHENTSDFSEQRSSSNMTGEEPFELMTFEETWQEEPLSKACSLPIKTLVCFLSHPENQQTFTQVLKTLDPQVKVIFIAQGDDKQHSVNVYGVAQANRGTFETTFTRVRKDHGDVDAMLYLWPLEDSRCIQDVSPLVYILQAMASIELNTKRFLLAGEFANDVERCYLDSWIGFERSLGLILPRTRVAVVYQAVSARNRKAIVADWTRKLWAELRGPDARSVMYQDEKRHVCRILPVTLNTEEKGPFKQGGTYLITGGCGALGFLFAERLAKTYGAHLILTGRSPLTPEKQTRIRALEQSGCSIFYLQVDVCDVREMKKGLRRAQERLGPIRGVLHAAGTADDRTLLEKEIRCFQEVLNPAIKGTIKLDEILAEEPLDFVCYFSSSAALLGDFGACDYAIGNRFQMAYAHYRNALRARGKRSGKTLVINWPLWKEGGMAQSDDERVRFYLKSSGQRPLTSRQGLNLCERLLSQDKTQYLVLLGQPSRVRRFLGVTSGPSASSASIPVGTPGRGRRPEMRGLSVEECVTWELKELMSRLLKMNRDHVDGATSLADAGFDSIGLAKLARLLTRLYGIEVTPALFFGYSTPEQLARYFVTEHENVIVSFYQEEEVSTNVFDPSRAPVSSERIRSRPARARFSERDAPSDLDEPIAIIGMSGRFPQARDIDAMWKILSEGKQAVAEIPADRFDWRKVYGDPAQDVHKTNCKWSGSIPGVAEFDPLFFEISPRAAENIDPRQRQLLQESWNALEDAGYGVQHINTHTIGMFVGVEEGDYQRRVTGGDLTSNHNGILAARLAYFLNLNGPTMAINTACSSSLVAAHQACLSLRLRECDTALAAGANLMLTPECYVAMTQTGMLSDDGRCYAFDKRANGMVPGEAVVAVVLKRLSRAEADGDPIHAVIRGSGINYDGKTNGITAPSSVAQTDLLKSVYAKSRTHPENIDYIITHGTGTKLGDSVEINALCDAFKEATQKQGYCALTSSKTNFGHTFAASGLLSVLGLVQALRHEMIPASLNIEKENEYIHWSESPFYVNRSGKPWPKRPGAERIGAVSAFGMSGTNAHMVLQEYTAQEQKVSRAFPAFLLVLSAKTEEALTEKIKAMIAFLQKDETHELDMGRMSYTLLEGRHHFRYRCAIVAQSREEALLAWKQIGQKEKSPYLFWGQVARDFRGQETTQRYAEELVRQSGALQGDTKKYRDTLCALAELYCQGYELLWSGLYGNEERIQQIHLPTYPFARTRYWLEESGTETDIGMRGVEDAAASQKVEPGLNLESYLAELISEQFKIQQQELEWDRALEEYGLDSIIAAALVRKIKQKIKNIPESLFLECGTLGDVKQYIMEHHGEALNAFRPDVKRDRSEKNNVPLAKTPVNGNGTFRHAPRNEDAVQANPYASIIGMAGLFPGANSIHEFWDHLVARKVVTSKLPERRMKLMNLREGFNSEGREIVGGYLDRIEYFDHLLFNVPQDEARTMDPQLRKLLEIIWQAILDGGYTLRAFRKARTGLFVGTRGHSGYQDIVTGNGQHREGSYAESPALYANRISNILNIRGPSEIVETGCSSFLVAIKHAMTALRDGRCKQAIVAAADVTLTPQAYARKDTLGLYSTQASTKSFAADSDGYVKSEVIGAIILKSEADALQDGDPIYATIKGVGVCHGGKAPIKWYSPNITGQKLAIEEALAESRVDPEDVAYIEAEANGSQLGDVSEIVAIQSCYAADRKSGGDQSALNGNHKIRIGSLKPLVGHAENASTFPGLVKLIYSMRYGRMLRVEGLHELNKGINLEDGFEILKDDVSWGRLHKNGVSVPRYGALHSLSVGGVNAHLILEERKEEVPVGTAAQRPCYIFVFSERSEALLRDMINTYIVFLERADEQMFDSAGLLRLEYTLQCCREVYEHRLAVVAKTRGELIHQLKKWHDGAEDRSEIPGWDNVKNRLSAVSKNGSRRAEAKNEKMEKLDEETCGRMARAWVQDGAIPKDALYGAQKIRKINIPANGLNPVFCWHKGIQLEENSKPSVPAVETIILKPKWESKPIVDVAPVPSAFSRTVIFCDWPTEQTDAFTACLSDIDQTRSLHASDDSCAERFLTYAEELFQVVKEVLLSKPKERVYMQIVLPSGLDRVYLHGFVALMKTARQEHSRFIGQVIVFHHAIPAEGCVARLADNIRHPEDIFIQYIDKKRRVQGWMEIDVSAAPSEQLSSTAIWKEGGIVLITGGAGRIGLLLAKDIVQQTKNVTIILTGRRKITPTQKKEVETLEKSGGSVTYIQTDISNKKEVNELISIIQKRYGSLTSIIHGAGIIQDNYIIKKSVEEFNSVLGPKVSGLAYLDEATQSMNLDLILLCSSLAGAWGSPGQADYATGNAFMDAYAVYRNQLVALGARQGHTVSVNLPLWADGGMRVDRAVEQLIKQTYHLAPMPSDVGVQVLRTCAQSTESQTLVMYGAAQKIKALFVRE